ncbi:MAG: glycosyltransferase family 39 protein [Caldilineaceae bacterium]
MHTLLTKLYSKERWVIIAIALVGLALRFWALGDKGLAYDEAATALMARASGPAIIQFHWNAAFEHPPLWQLTMRAWSALFGQSEAMLRLLPALAGAAAVPLTWYWLRQLWSRAVGLRLLAAAFVALSPVLVLYAQEARMYTVVVLLALLSLLALVELARRPSWTSAALFVVVNWLMLGYHYYSLLLVGSEWIFFFVLTVRNAPLIGTARKEDWRGARWWDGACLVSIIPILLWMLFSPGFQDTLTAVTRSMAGGTAPALFFDGIWRDLSFGAFRWQPDIAALGYLLLPLVAIGVYAVVRSPLTLVDALPDVGFAPVEDAASAQPASVAKGPVSRPHARVPRARKENDRAAQKAAADWGWLVVIVGLLPLFVSVVLFRTLAARYILFILPAVYTLAAAGIVWLGRRHWTLGLLGIVLAAVPAVVGLGYYYGFYHKSEYRDMAAYLREHIGPDDAVMLYAPRQHLLAKYYLGGDRTYYTAPQVDLPDYWPVNAPPVVPEEMDGQIQDLLAAHPAVWLVMTAQDEVDDGEFVPKYFAAVAYKQDCHKWIDVELCRFVGPTSELLNGQSASAGHAAEPVTPDLLYNGELRLQRAQARLVDEPQLGQSTIYTELDWLAEHKPTVDYRVTLRLLDSSGQVVAQRDEYPIGQLLPPTTWNQGDAKPGYMALPTPNLPAGAYQVTVDAYDPTTEASYAAPVTIARYSLPMTLGE